MKRTFSILLPILLFLSSYAQQNSISNEKLKFRNNWFVQGQTGMAYSLSEYYHKASFSDIIAPHFALAIGKHTSPILSTRLQIEGWESKNFTLLNEYPQTYKIKYFQINLDRQFNLTTIIKRELSDYSPFYFTANVGIGYAHGFKNSKMQTKNTNMIVPRLGLSANWQLNNIITLNFEMTANFYPDRFNGRVYGKKYDGIINAMFGIKYNLGEKQKQASYSSENALNKNQIDEIYNIMKQQKEDNNSIPPSDNLSNNSLKTDYQSKEIISNLRILMNAIITFERDDINIKEKQKCNIKTAAKYLQENLHINVIITGYSNNDTEHKKIVRQRIHRIREILISQYNISPNRILVNTMTNLNKTDTVVFMIF